MKENSMQKKSSLSKEEYKNSLKRIRITQKEFAKLCGIAESTAKGWFGSREFPYWAELILRQMEQIQKYKKAAASFREMSEALNEADFA